MNPTFSNLRPSLRGAFGEAPSAQTIAPDREEPNTLENTPACMLSSTSNSLAEREAEGDINKHKHLTAPLHAAKAQLRKQGWTDDDLAKIEKHHGGQNTITTTANCLPTLCGLGLQKKEIMQIAVHDGAAQAINTLLENQERLRQAGFNLEQIVKIASNIGAAQAINTLLDNLEPLKQAGFNPEQMVKIASNNGAAQAINTLLDNLEPLKQAGFNPEQMVKIAGNDGAAQAINTLLDNLEPLKQAGFNPEQMVKIASNNGAAQAINTLLDNLEPLKQAGFNPEQMVKIASNNGARQALTQLVTHHQTLVEHGLDTSQITDLAGVAGGGKNVEAAASQTWPGCLAAKEMLSITARLGGAEKLEWFLSNHAKLTAEKFSRAEILALARMDKPRRIKKLQANQGGVKRPAAHASRPNKRTRTQPVTVKSEPQPASAAPQTGWETQRLNTAQTRLIPTTHYPLVDLTNEAQAKVGIVVVQHTDEAMTVTERQIHDPLLDQRFPIRDPRHPERVHPDYANDNGEGCAPQVRLHEVAFYKGPVASGEFVLWQRVRHLPGNLARFNNQADFMKALKTHAQAEMNALIRGTRPPSLDFMRIDKINNEAQCDSQAEFRALKGQYGVFPLHEDATQQPLLAYGRVAGIFAGSKLETAEDERAYKDTFGETAGGQALYDYAATVKKYRKPEGVNVDWAPFGGGNMTQFINSSFKKSQGKWVVDGQRTNCIFAPVIFTLSDKNGQMRQETMFLVLQTQPVAPSKQFKLDYGPSYTLPEPSSRPPQVVVKQEPAA